MISKDLVLTGARVLTMTDGPRYTATAIGVRDGRIAAVGTDTQVRDAMGPGTTEIELAGRVVLPSFTDTHTHLSATASWRKRVDVRDFYGNGSSIEYILGRFGREAGKQPDGELVAAMGSPMQEFRLGRFPTAHELDEVVPDRPAFITFGGHVTVANSLALKLVGFDSATTDPAGGIIERDAQGRPTGLLRERAQLPLWGQENAGSFEDFKQSIYDQLMRAASRGVTTIHEILDKPAELRAFQELAREGRLAVRVEVIVRVVESRFDKWGLLNLGLQHGIGDDKLRIGGIKMSIDGGFTGRQSAWTHTQDEPHGNHPLIRIEQDELDDVVARYHEAGMRILVHACGDIANDMILSSYEKALRKDDSRDLRHRIEHMGNWLASEDRLARARSLGITPVPNPVFMYYLGREAEATLGRSRTEDSFPIARLLDAGFPVTLGTDAPLYWPVDPLRDAGVCVTRQTRDGMVIAADQAIDNYAALQAITSAPAWLGYREDTLGTITVGKLADLAVLDGDPLDSTGGELAAIPVHSVYVSGREIWNLAGSDMPFYV